jgi:hypothetical protein
MAEEKPVFHPTIGREGETAALLSRCPLSLTLTLAVSPHVNSIVRRFLVKLGARIYRSNI